MPSTDKKIRAKHRRTYYEKHREQEIAQASAWDKRFPEVRNATRKAYRAKLRQDVLKALGGGCAYCPETDPLVLQIDHVFDNGKEDDLKFQNRSSPAYLKHVLADDTGAYQLLCANCNICKYFKRRVTNPVLCGEI